MHFIERTEPPMQALYALAAFACGFFLRLVEQGAVASGLPFVGGTIESSQFLFVASVAAAVAASVFALVKSYRHGRQAGVAGCSICLVAGALTGFSEVWVMPLVMGLLLAVVSPYLRTD